MTLRKLGSWRKEPPDAKDKIFADNAHKMLLLESPSGGTCDLRRWCSPVENQSQLSSCAANAAVGGLELSNIIKGKPHVDLSRLFVYYNARLAMNEAEKDEGAYIRFAIASLSKQGVCEEALWAYDISTVFLRPSWAAYKQAFVNKINEYYRIDTDGSERIDDIKKALEARCPVIFGMIVDDDFKAIGSDGRVSMPRQVRSNPGAHAMLIVGYKDHGDTLIIRNSWGTSWGDDGYCYVPSAALVANNAQDFWTFL